MAFPVVGREALVVPCPLPYSTHQPKPGEEMRAMPEKEAIQFAVTETKIRDKKVGLRPSSVATVAR